jgi:hypothetical protein
MWRAIRWPVGAVVVSGALIGLAFLLDMGGREAREAALAIGAYSTVLLLPASVIWLLVAIVLHLRDRRRETPKGELPSG